MLNIEKINQRLDAVEFFQKNFHIADSLRSKLRGCADLERCLSRLSIGRGGPLDLYSISCTLGTIELIHKALADSLAKQTGGLPTLVEAALASMGRSWNFMPALSTALVDQPPVTTTYGGYIAPGFDHRLDDYRELRDNGFKAMRAMAERYRSSEGSFQTCFTTVRYIY